MAPMTEAPHHNSAESVSHFYDALAEDYDAMTDLSERFHRERPAFQLLVDRYGIRSAADAGTGTGFHALLLAELGVDITAVDISARMADRLRAHARDRALPVRVVVGDIRKLHQHTPERSTRSSVWGTRLHTWKILRHSTMPFGRLP